MSSLSFLVMKVKGPDDDSEQKQEEAFLRFMRSNETVLIEMKCVNDLLYPKNPNPTSDGTDLNETDGSDGSNSPTAVPDAATTEPKTVPEYPDQPEWLTTAQQSNEPSENNKFEQDVEEATSQDQSTVDFIQDCLNRSTEYESPIDEIESPMTESTDIAPNEQQKLSESDRSIYTPPCAPNSIESFENIYETVYKPVRSSSFCCYDALVPRTLKQWLRCLRQNRSHSLDSSSDSSIYMPRNKDSGVSGERYDRNLSALDPNNHQYRSLLAMVLNSSDPTANTVKGKNQIKKSPRLNWAYHQIRRPSDDTPSDTPSATKESNGQPQSPEPKAKECQDESNRQSQRPETKTKESQDNVPNTGKGPVQSDPSCALDEIVMEGNEHLVFEQKNGNNWTKEERRWHWKKFSERQSTFTRRSEKFAYKDIYTSSTTISDGTTKKMNNDVDEKEVYSWTENHSTGKVIA